MSQESKETLTLQPGIQFEKIGEVDVDSGQILLIDPGYIDGFWKNEPVEIPRIYHHASTGQALAYRKDFSSYDQIIDGYGRSMNELIGSGDWIKQVTQPGTSLSAQNCALTSCLPAKAGKVGGLGTVLQTALGDGLYTVYAQRDADGAILRVLLDLNPLSDEDE
jgi:hypothetical protein